MIDVYRLMHRHRIPFLGDGNYFADGNYLAGKTVLVTGAGGSIGSALCRRLATTGLKNLVMLDRDESALHAVQLDITGRALLSDASTVLGDIRDIDWLHHIMGSLRPDMVFHAAALKHQPMLEMYPTEAVKTNIVGTWNVLRAAHLAGVGRLVNVSTDKAADPCCALGASKRIAERLVSGYAPDGYVSVRFGNVLGSRGSVLETFSRQLERGLCVTVTDHDAQRYFMSVDEAVDLLLYAARYATPGTAHVMRVGSVRIADLARRLAQETGTTARIVYTGIRRNERLVERLVGSAEVPTPTGHPMIDSIDVPALPVIIDRQRLTSHLADLTSLVPADVTTKAMIDLCGWRAV